MEQVFSYIIGLGAAVMMPILFTILGVCIGINFGKALKSGLLVGVGFVGLSVVTALLTSSLGEPLKKVTEIYGLELGIFDMGVACCSLCSLQHFCRCIHHSCMFGSEHHHAINEDN